MSVKGTFHDYHTNVYLTGHYLRYTNPGMIADIVCPRVRVQNANDKYPVWDKKNFKLVNTLRADKTPSGEFKRGWSDGTYSCEEYALHYMVSQKERANADSPVDPEFELLEEVGEVIDLDREDRVHTLASASASVASANKKTLEQGKEWNQETSSSARIFSDIAWAKGQIWAAIRKRANCLILPYEDALKISENQQIRDRLKGIDYKQVTLAGLPSKIAGLWVIEAGAGYNSAKQGQTVDIASVWTSGTAYVAYIDGLSPTDDLLDGGSPYRLINREKPQGSANKLTWIRTFDWKGRTVRQWHKEELASSDVYEVAEQGIDEVLITSSAACKFSNTIA